MHGRLFWSKDYLVKLYRSVNSSSCFCSFMSAADERGVCFRVIPGSRFPSEAHGITGLKLLSSRLHVHGSALVAEVY